MALKSKAEILIDVDKISKCYHLYQRPRDRLLQSLFRGRRTFHREFWALRDISFHIRRGEAVAIIGRNGAGKSTLLQLIAGTLTPTSGNLQIHGRVAALLQLGSGFNPEFTGRENVFLNGSIMGFTRAQIERRFDEIADFADIGDFVEQPVKTYSSGMTMRLAFAVSICLEPEILIVDEALAVGDAVFQFKCKNRLRDLIANGTTLLFVSHDMSAVKAFCNRAIYLENGQTKCEGEPETIAERYFMDVRAEQTRNAQGDKDDSGSAVRRKESGGYGTKDGEIISAHFTAARGTDVAFSFGHTVELEIVCRFAKHIELPCMSVVIQANNLVGIGGRWLKLKRPDSADGHVTCKVRFPANFNEGKYFVTLRLEVREQAHHSLILHKIPGALSFDVLKQSNNDLLGFRDLEIEFEQ